MQDLILTHKITSYECGADQLLKPECFQLLCQEMAEEHAERNNLGYEWGKSNNKAWVQVQGNFEFVRRPTWKETVTMRTNTGAATALQARRFVEMSDAEGNVIARADLLWVLIDITTRRPTAFRRVGLDIGDTCEQITTELTEPEWPTDPIATAEITASRRDVDFNVHINNSAYLIWALDTLPQEAHPKGAPIRYHITFRRESHANQQMSVAHYVNDNYSRHIISSGDEIRAEIAVEWA